RRGDLQREGRVVAGQYCAGAISDDAAVGDDGDQGDPVVLGAGLVKIVLDDLQPDETAEQQAKGEQDRRCRDAQAEAETVYVTFGVVKIAHELPVKWDGWDPGLPVGTAAEAG